MTRTWLILHIAFLALVRGEPGCVNSLAHASEIHKNPEKSVLLIGKSRTVCFEYAKKEFEDRGCQVKILELNSMELNEYQKCFPNELIGGMEMHSFIFVGQEMVGNGHEKAETWNKPKLQSACPQKSNDEECKSGELAKIGKSVQAALSSAKSGIYLWGWAGCPCVATATSRFTENKVCFKAETWDSPSDKRMAYFHKCTEATHSDHSFIFVWDGTKMKFQGNGFRFDEQEMSSDAFNKLVTTSKAKTSCERPGMEGAALNLYDEPLQKCSHPGHTGNAGSSQNNGKCDELGGGVHSLCVNELPPDFSSETGQSAWSSEKQGQPWCVCIGAWSMYQAKRHNVGANCNAIPDFVFKEEYIGKWSTWNGNELQDQIIDGINELYKQCKSDASSSQLTALKKHYCNIAEKYKGKTKQFGATDQFKDAGCKGAQVSLGTSLVNEIDEVQSNPLKMIVLGGILFVGVVYIASRCFKSILQKDYEELHGLEEESYSTFVSIKREAQ